MLTTERYTFVDRLLHRLAFATAGVQIELADLEDRIYSRAVADTPVTRPVFITALPRAGTTLLLELCSNLEEFASHRYRDMPFVLLPLLWHDLSKGFRRNTEPTERAHGDGIMVHVDSPEAFEEMLWKARCPRHYLSDRIVPWGLDGDGEVRQTLTAHMKKVIRLRQQRPDVLPRYVSKNNCNIARLGYLRQCWPDAVIVVLVRDPAQHAASLVRQHRRFLELHARDSFARDYMKGVGHFDFGANLRPIDFDGWLSAARWTDSLTIEFWLEYWVAAYRHLLSDDSGSFHFLPFDEFCADPAEGLRWLAGTLGIMDRQALMTQRTRVRVPPHHQVEPKPTASALLLQAQELYHEVLRRSDLGRLH